MVAVLLSQSIAVLLCGREGGGGGERQGGSRLPLTKGKNVNRKVAGFGFSVEPSPRLTLGLS
jgi:hypothetical protein